MSGLPGVSAGDQGEVLGSRVWTRFSPEDIKVLRASARNVLQRLGAQPWQVTDQECDKWIESRYEATLNRWVEYRKRNG